MTEKDLQTYCRENGVPCKQVGDRLRVLDLSQLPEHMRANFDEQGYFTTSADKAAKKEVAEAVVKPLKGKLPEDFPGHTALEEAGITTYSQLRKYGDVTEIDGIGPATAEKIAAALGETDEGDDEDAQSTEEL